MTQFAQVSQVPDVRMRRLNEGNQFLEINMSQNFIVLFIKFGITLKEVNLFAYTYVYIFSLKIVELISYALCLFCTPDIASVYLPFSRVPYEEQFAVENQAMMYREFAIPVIFLFSFFLVLILPGRLYLVYRIAS